MPSISYSQAIKNPLPEIDEASYASFKLVLFFIFTSCYAIYLMSYCKYYSAYQIV